MKDIETLIREFPDDEELGMILMKLGNHYDVLRKERSNREWLQKVLGILRFAP